MIKNYTYDGTLKDLIAQKEARGAEDDDFENVRQNQDNVILDTPVERYNEGIALGDPDSADIRIVALGHAQCGNSSLMLRLFYNEWTDDPLDCDLLQWDQHQMQTRY